MRKLILVLLACLLLTVSCEAKEAFWYNPASRVLNYGARGVIVPRADGDIAQDNACLNTARSKAPYITWSLAAGVNSAMPPQAIAAALGSSADFFLLYSERDLPMINEAFPPQDLSYVEREWMEVTIERTDDKGKIKDRYSFTEYDRSFDRMMHFPGKEVTLCPTIVSLNLYDMNATELLSGVEMAWPDDYARAHSEAAGCFFGKTLTAVLSGKPDKVDKQKVKSDEWADPAFNLKGNNGVSVAMPQLNEPLLAGLDNYAKIFQQAAFEELSEKKKLMVTYNENAPLRVEIQVQQYHDNFYRSEPHVNVWERSDTNYNYRKHRGDNYRDTFREERHWTEASLRGGNVVHDVTLNVVVRVVAAATGRPVYIYTAHTKDADRKYDGYLSIMRDFAKKLQKKLG